MSAIDSGMLPEMHVAHPKAIAPAWHTAVLVAAIAAISVAGKLQLAGAHHAPHRLLTYATTAGMELLLFGWAVVGLRLHKTSIRSVVGAVASSWQGFALDLCIAAVFWIGALMVLGTAGMLWTSVQLFVAQAHRGNQSLQALESGLKNGETLRVLEQLAPANAQEIACWAALCCLVGAIEEFIFRGYLQQQFIAWTHGQAVWGVMASALLFGAGHGYQGLRNMVLLGLFGALFSGLALVRRNLRSGMIAHSWHDLIAGLMLAFLRSHHLA
ncbi:MAG TPA: CPBP family intramembrane glutamic endopeptidase [Terracidiphilus sp.]|jgi:hypothetical protein|nr:CPBP family intramembrane glutamic endopeptidase [Terracidiphilus sp.]